MRVSISLLYFILKKEVIWGVFIRWWVKLRYLSHRAFFVAVAKCMEIWMYKFGEIHPYKKIFAELFIFSFWFSLVCGLWFCLVCGLWFGLVCGLVAPALCVMVLFCLWFVVLFVVYGFSLFSCFRLMRNGLVLFMVLFCLWFVVLFGYSRHMRDGYSFFFV